MADNKYKKYSLMWLLDVEELFSELEKEEKEKKKEKLIKKIEKSKRLVKENVNLFIKNDGEMEDIVKELNPFQLSILEELFPEGTDSQSIEMKKETQRYKQQLEKIKEAAEKDGYEADWPFERKRKTKQYAEHDHLYRMIKLHSEIDHKRYVDIWNYKRDYEATKDKYFTPEEQAIIAECLAVEEERKVWFAEKYPWRVELGEKLCDTAAKIEEWGDLTQVKMDAMNLAEEVFPRAAEQILGKGLSKAERMEEGRLMARRYIEYRRDAAREAAALSLAAEAIEKAGAMVDGAWEPMEEEKEKFKGATGMVLDFIADRAERQIKDELFIESVALKLLEAEHGKEEARFIMLLNHEQNRESRSERFRKYSFEDMGI